VFSCTCSYTCYLPVDIPCCLRKETSSLSDAISLSFRTVNCHPMQVNVLYSLERNFSAFIQKFTRNFTQYTFVVYSHRICCTVCVHCCFFCALDAGLLARSQYSEGPATGHLDTGSSCFPCVYKQMLRWFPRLQVATTCFSCSPPDLNLVVTNFLFCLHVK